MYRAAGSNRCTSHSKQEAKTCILPSSLPYHNTENLQAVFQARGVHGTHSIVGYTRLLLHSLSLAEGCAVRPAPPIPRAAVVNPSSLCALSEWRDALVLLRSPPHMRRAERKAEGAGAQWEQCPDSLIKGTYRDLCFL